MALYDPVNGVYRKVSKKYDPVDGVYRKVKAAYDPVDGVYRQYFSSGTPVGSLAVGDSVWLNVDGVLTEFLVVHQGNPDSAIYDASCDGTWLLMKDIYTKKAWDSYGGDYDWSEVRSYLENTFFKLFDSDIQAEIRGIKVPRYFSDCECVCGGSDGLDAKIFLLSYYEVGFAGDIGGVDGSCLDYFSGATNATRIATQDGTNAAWWLRSADVEDYGYSWCVSAGGGTQVAAVTTKYGIRPAFVLDSATII